MRIRKNFALCAALAAAMLVSLAACAKRDAPAQAADAQYLNGGMTLTVPAEYKDLVLVDMPEDDADGVLFVVSEKASVEAAKADGQDFDGVGELFGVRRVDADTLHELLCYDMSGAEVFAKGADGAYYLYTYPTDVRLYRSGDDYADAMEQWSALNEWGWSRRDRFIADNAGLEAFTRGNSEPEMYLNRAAYLDDAGYTLSMLTYGPQSTYGVDAAPYVERLLDGLTVEYADDVESPDGEYLVLNFFNGGTRFDFFPREGLENLVRMTGYNGEAMFRFTYAGDTKAGDVMQEWYDALAAVNGPAVRNAEPDDLVGRWAEKVAGRGVITIGKRGDAYDVTVEWANSAFEQSYWEMTAEPTGNGAEVRYENGRYAVRAYDSNGNYTEDVRYENGTGTFSLDAGEVVWEDDVDGVADGSVFTSIE